MYSLQAFNSLSDAQECAKKCVANEKTGYSFSVGADSVNWWKDIPEVKIYEIINVDGTGAGMVAGKKFKYGNSWYFFMNQLGRYANVKDTKFTENCLDAINNSMPDIKGVVLHPVNDILKEHYLRNGVTMMNKLVADSMKDFCDGRECDMFYPRSETIKKQNPSEAVYEYLGTYSGNSGVGTNGGGSGSSPYFVYQILSLNSTLSQKGNTTKPSKFHLLVGDTVEGVCALDNKKHKGVIQKFFVSDTNADTMEPTYIYILDTNAMVVPLFPKTIVKIVKRSLGAVDPHSKATGQYPGLF